MKSYLYNTMANGNGEAIDSLAIDYALSHGIIETKPAMRYVLDHPLGPQIDKDIATKMDKEDVMASIQEYIDAKGLVSSAKAHYMSRFHPQTSNGQKATKQQAPLFEAIAYEHVIDHIVKNPLAGKPESMDNRLFEAVFSVLQALEKKDMLKESIFENAELQALEAQANALEAQASAIKAKLALLQKPTI